MNVEHADLGLPTWESDWRTHADWRLGVWFYRQRCPVAVPWAGVIVVPLQKSWWESQGSFDTAAYVVRWWNWCMVIRLGRRRWWLWHFVERVPTARWWRRMGSR